MNIQPGTIVRSTAEMNDPVFKDAVIFITQKDAGGAVGFVVNKVFERPLHALQEFSHIRPFNLYAGGPVDKEHLFFIHCRPDIIEGGKHICNGIFAGGDFTAAVKALNNYMLTEKEIKICIGYCGWDEDELEAEIAEGSWQLEPFEETIVFSR